MIVINDPMQVKIRSSITDESVLLPLSNDFPADSIAPFYEAFKHLKLSGPVMRVKEWQPLLTPEKCKDYADDFLYDEQQCLIYFSERQWEHFDLVDTAFFMGYLHVFSVSDICSAMPFMIEIMLRADGWVDSFDSLVSKLRKDAKGFNSELSRTLGVELAETVVSFLSMLRSKAEKYEKYETITVINRGIEAWKNNIKQAQT